VATWERQYSAGERRAILRAATRLCQASKQLLELSNEYLQSARESAEKRQAIREAEARREQIREWTRKLGAA
jgi:hypothetical protein